MGEETLKAKSKNVEEIKEKINKAQTIILVDYRGLNVAELTELRSEYRKSNVDYKVYKNTMMRFAFKDSGFEDFNQYLTGPNAVAFGYDDPVEAAKITAKFAEDNDKIEIKAGIIDGKIIDVDAVKHLASLPSKEVLIAQTLGGLNAPIQGFANVLQGTIRGFATVLSAISEKQEA